MNNHISEIQNKLLVYLKKEQRNMLLQNMLLCLLLVFTVFFVLVFLESLLNFSSSIRTVLFTVFFLASTLLISVFVIYPVFKNIILFGKPNFVDAAKIIGNRFPEIKDELANSLQLFKNKSSLHSEQLINAALERIYSKTINLDFNSVVDNSKLKKIVKYFLLIVVMFLIVLGFVPSLNSAAFRVINFSKEFIAPAEFYFKVYPGNVNITKGESVDVKIEIVGKILNEIALNLKGEDQTEFESKKLVADSSGTFSYRLISLKNSVEYFVSANKVVDRTYKISVINRPVINRIDVEIYPPSYSRIPKQLQRDNGNINALPGSKINLSITASRELSGGKIVFNDSLNKPLSISYNKGTANFNITNNSEYKVFINDKENIQNSEPISYTIKTLYDEAPTIELVSPDNDLKLGNENIISIITKISDDYGFSKLELNYKLLASKYRQPFNEYAKIPLPFSKNNKEDEIYYTWNLSSLVLAEGESISFFVEVVDNNNITGYKTARTKDIKIFIPSIDELFQSAEAKQENAVQDLAKTFKDAEKLKEELQKISNDMKQNSKEISWQEKEKIDNATDKFQKLGEKLQEAAQKLAETKQELMKNNLLSEETITKYNELQKLLDEFNSEELKAAFRKMQDALKSLSRDNVQMSLEELKNNEEYIKNSIERTLNLLKRIQAEQKVDELVKRSNDLSKKIDDLKEQTENNNLSDNKKRDELEKRQQDITDKLNQLKEEMGNLGEKMNNLNDMPKELLDNISKEFEKQNNAQLSNSAQKQLSQNQKMNALKNQQQLSSNMQSMTKQFENLQSQMQQMNQMRSFYEMAKILDDLLSLSKSQENLKNTTEQLGQLQEEANKISRQQNQIQTDLTRIMESMSSASQKTFAITPEMGRALGKAYSEMQQSQSALQNQNSPIAGGHQKNAMQSLNEAASLLKGSMDQMMNGGQGGGMMSLMQQLQQMSQQQMNLNQLTQMLNQGQMTQEMMSQMQRLAQQQEMIRKSLEQLNNEAKSGGQSKKLASNLENILKEMKEVVSNLESEKMNDNIVKQQEKILSKLLDAQRSMNERDFEENRKSTSGQNTARTSPPELILSTEEGRNKLRDELQKAIKEGYKKDYEDLIRKYFEALEKATNK